MRILLSCAGGMSSSIVADAIAEAAKQHGIEDFVIEATGTESVSEDLSNKNYDLILLAPQVNYRIKYIKELADPKGIPVLPIKGTEYNPLAGESLFKQIKTELSSK